MRLVRTLVVAVAASAAALAFVPAAATHGTGGGGGGNWNGGGHWHGGGQWHGGHWHGGYYPYWPVWGGVAVGVGIGYYGGYYGGYYPYPYPYWSSGWGPYGPYYSDAPVAAAPAYGADQTTHSGQPVPQASAPPEPIFYPRNGQSAETTENDRRECNRWATTQPGAMTDASIFQRATFACMEGRGYTVR
jgi:hypothetical protein